MKIQVDTHTHTNVSDHAYGTLWENIKMAKEYGLLGVCVTDHGPAISDGAHRWHFENMQETLPPYIEGVRVFQGAEVNILSPEGEIDLSERVLGKLEVVIASVHPPCFAPKTEEEYTQTLLNITQNPYVDILGHTGRYPLAYDYEQVILAAKNANQCIEINSHSLERGETVNTHCREIALACKRLGAPIMVGSDSHSPFGIGNLERAVRLLAEIDFPNELIVNLTMEGFEGYLKERKESRPCNKR